MPISVWSIARGFCQGVLKGSSSRAARSALMSVGLLIGSALAGCSEISEDGPAGDPTASLPPGAQGVGVAPPASAAPTPEPTITSREAQVGVGDRGQGYDGLPFTQTAATYWKAQEKIAFEIQVPHALQLYKALQTDGKGPGSHEIFMRDVIAANNIELPRLPEGSQYRYDPDSETLFVDSVSQ